MALQPAPDLHGGTVRFPSLQEGFLPINRSAKKIDVPAVRVNLRHHSQSARPCYDLLNWEDKLKSFRMISEGSFVIAASFLVVLAVADLTINAWGWNSGNVASWVQAVGSIAAIVGAYIIGERQTKTTLRATQEAHKLAEKARHEERQLAESEKRAGMLSVISAAHSRAKAIEAALNDPYPPLAMYEVYHSSLIDSLVDLMSKMPASELGSDQAINSFIVFSGQFTFLKGAVDKYLAGPYGSEETKKEVESLREQGYGGEDVRKLVESARDSLRKNVRTHLTRIESEYLQLLASFSKDV